MIPHKTKRGQAALERLKVFEGTPFPFDKMKRVVVPFALRVLRLKPGRKYCRLGDLASSVGWAHNGLIKKLEDKRLTGSAAHYLRKKQLALLKKKATENVAGKLTKVTASAPAPAEKKETKKEKKADAPAPKQEKKADAPAAKQDKKPAADKKEKAAPAAAEKKEKAAPAADKKEKAAAPAADKKDKAPAAKKAAPKKKEKEMEE